MCFISEKSYHHSGSFPWSCSYNVDYHVLQDALLAGMSKMQEEYDQQMDKVGELFVALSQDVPKHQRDEAWIRRRRDVQRQQRALFRWRDGVEHAMQDHLRAEAWALSHDYRDLEDLLVWADFADSAIAQSAERKAQAEEMRARQQSAASQCLVGDVACGADDRYRAWIETVCGRTTEEGPPGITDGFEPSLPQNWQIMSMKARAHYFMDLLGYRSAEQFDEHGWTALHFACQASVYWSEAPSIVRGLMTMMSQDWLRAKTKGGRPSHTAALHMLSTGSDCSLQRADLVWDLIFADADIDVEDEKGRTPFLLATGTGVLDTAKALSHAGANIWAAARDGRNAADRASGSSGQMARYSGEMNNSFGIYF